MKPAKHSAPGQYLGFALQPVRLCYHLLTCPAGAKVSLEYLDDIAIHAADGSVTLEQTKSALKQNPLSDWANDFWKALANWLDAVEKGTAPGDAEFRLYVTPVRTGPRAQAMSDATTKADVASITAALAADVAKLKKPPGCMEFVQRFLDATDEERFCVVSRLTVVSTDDDPVAPIRDRLSTAVPPAILDHLCQAAIGMAKQQADRLIQEGKPAFLDGDAFKVEFRAFVQKNNLPGLLVPLTGEPPAGTVASILAGRPTFIRQLELVELPEHDKVRAVSDFLRASANKAEWADAGLIFKQSLDEWDQDLVRHHGLIAGEIEDVFPEIAAARRGRIVYGRCCQVREPLDGRAVPLHFISGCFNELADDRRLGWHPDHHTLLDADQA